VFCNRLTAHWDPKKGFFDFASGKGIPVLLASFWASISRRLNLVSDQEDLGVIGGVEIIRQNLLKSKLLASCGEYVAKMWNLDGPKITLQCGELESESAWSTDDKFAFLKNCKFGDNKEINKHPYNYLCREKTKLVCFQFSAFPFSSASSECIV